MSTRPSWQPQKSGTDKHLLRVHFVDARTGWVVGEGGTILATRDGGTHWEPQKGRAQRNLLSVHFADAHTGWAVGNHGTMLHAGSPIYPPSIEDIEMTSEGINDLEVSFRVKPDPNANVTAAHISARVREAPWTPPGLMNKTDAADGKGPLWHLTWKPATLAGSGDEVEYQVQLDDGGPPIAVSLGKFTYDPLLMRLWRENQTALADSRR